MKDHSILIHLTICPYRKYKLQMSMSWASQERNNTVGGHSNLASCILVRPIAESIEYGSASIVII